MRSHCSPIRISFGSAAAQDKKIVIGVTCDRTGPTQIVGTVLCPAEHDYFDYINATHGLDGFTIDHPEIETQYKVPAAVEAYQRQKQQGAIMMPIYGTPQTHALNERLEQDKIVGTTPGFGIAASADGAKYPYLFPIAASYFSQGAAAVKFAKDQLGGSLKGKKIAYLYYDNPAGTEPIPVIKDLAKTEGFELRTFAVPPPGVELTAQVLDITQRYKADFVISHLFGRSPSVSIKAFKANGYPLSKVVGLVWASGEADIMAAGGWGVAQGYNTMQFAGAGDNYPIREKIREMYKKEGKTPPADMDNTVYYNRGLLNAAVEVQALRNALKLAHDQAPTGTDVKKGMEQIHDFSLGGLVPPLKITPEDHEGGGWVRIFRVKGNGFVPVTPWFNAYRDVVWQQVKAAEQTQ
ncbi:MAG: ABC transporter substrate-binding protein [Alphaproteobacteria bacterium]|nr:ABC transporter substrate-binding protein [Alphaproteobacteria bacterium]